jgi:beta-barrel assembly-enhancing protease
MKSLKLTSLIFLLPLSLLAQVRDIGVDFKKEGFIRFINPERRTAVIDFIVNKEVSTDLVRFNSMIQLSELKVGMEIMAEGEWFRNSNYSQVNKIVAKKKYDNTISIKNGRLDAIESDFAVIDGHRVKLNNNVIIKGANGYNKTFTSINQLLLGDIVEIKGKYRPDGFLYADSFKVEPDLETKEDVLAKSDDVDKVHRQFYASWQSKQTRRRVFNKKVLGFVVTNDEALQDYVNTLGMRLVPEHIKAKIKYMFIVVNDNSFNAEVLPNGLALVRTGLLKAMQNEAQLVAVLGHEIAHAIYEHGAKRHRDFNKAVESTKKVDKTKKTVVAFDNIATKQRGNIDIDPELSNLVLNDLPISTLEKKMSNFSVEEESQADRVGLYLMTKAGYDPTEASRVWKNVFQEYGNNEIQTKSYWDELVDVAYKNDKTTSTDIAKTVVSTKIDNNTLLSTKTHPYSLDRVKNLHEMTYFCWSSNDLLFRSTKGFDRWFPHLQRLNKKR